LYTTANNTLGVYSLSDLASPIATYGLGCNCFSGLIFENQLYLTGFKSIVFVFDVTSSNDQPLIPVTRIYPTSRVLKILRVGNELLLGELDGYLEVYDIKASNITTKNTLFDD
jgi:hypothetical protein